tara:strand:- start:153 stop:1019 length:867 start_codon:yes stop_codon:yes gene_type:complete
MPKVKGKKFPYTPEGEAAAAEYAQEHGAPFQMRAKHYGNSPMRKNFPQAFDRDPNAGGRLSLNRKLDKDNMSGGLTGQPSGETGKLGSGPIRKNSPMKKGGATATGGGAAKKGGSKPAGGKKGGSKPLFKNPKLTDKEALTRQKKFMSGFKNPKESQVGKFVGGFGKSIKQLGSQVESGVKKVGSNIKTKKPLLSGTFMGKGGAKVKKAHDAKFNKPNPNVNKTNGRNGGKGGNGTGNNNVSKTLKNFGITSGMDFKTAFKTAGKSGAKEGDIFTWNKKKYKYALKKK